MNRRDALKLLGSLPLLGFLALPEVELPEEAFITDGSTDFDPDLLEVGLQYCTSGPRFESLEQADAWRWNGVGDSWKKVNGEWVQVSSGGKWESVTAATDRGILYIDSAGHLNASGQLVRWNGKTWEPLPPE